MEIAQQVRDYAAKLNETPELAVQFVEEMAGKPGDGRYVNMTKS